MGGTDASALADKVLAGDRRALAQAITLIESNRPDDRPVARALLERLVPHSGNSFRIGLNAAKTGDDDETAQRYRVPEIGDFAEAQAVAQAPAAVVE